MKIPESWAVIAPSCRRYVQKVEMNIKTEKTKIGMIFQKIFVLDWFFWFEFEATRKKKHFSNPL